MRVLVIDDSRPQGMVVKYLLEREGMEVDHAPNNGEALAFLYAGRPYDAIIQDMGRPPDGVIRSSSALRKTGEVFYERYIRTICPDMPVILMTFYDRDCCFHGQLPPRCIYLSKNALPSELVATVRSAVENARKADEESTAGSHPEWEYEEARQSGMDVVSTITYYDRADSDRQAESR